MVVCTAGWMNQLNLASQKLSSLRKLIRNQFLLVMTDCGPLLDMHVCKTSATTKAK